MRDDHATRTGRQPRRAGPSLTEVPRPSRTEVTAELFQRLERAPGQAAQAHLREEIVLANATVARALARRYRDRGIDLDDLEQTAYLTLVTATRRFEPARGHDFLSFAVPSILGELRRHFRDFGWVIRVPRRVQEVQRLIDREDALVRDDHRYGASTVASLVDRLDLPASDVEAALQARGCFAPASLDLDLQDGLAGALGDPLDQDRAAREAAEARAMLAPVWRQLDVRERAVLRLRYGEDRTQAYIAAQLGVSQAQVSRILTGLLDDLREALTEGVGSSRLTG